MSVLRCKKCDGILNKIDLDAVPSGKYCSICGCKVYRYMLRQIAEERDKYKQKYEEIVKALS